MMPARLPGSSAGALASTSGRDPSGGRRFGCCAAPTFVIIRAGLGNQTAPARKMRSVLVRCLVALLTLALSGGNASARLHALYAEQSTPHTQHLTNTPSNRISSSPGRTRACGAVAITSVACPPTR